MTDLRRGLVALGDSITRGHGGAPVLGLHPQSWAHWVAEALALPFSNFAIDGEVAVGVVARQLPRLAGPYDVGTLFIGCNDARGMAFSPDEYEGAVRTTLAALAAACERVLLLTLPLDLGRPPAAPKPAVANGILRALAAETGVLLVELDDLAGPPFMLPDAVHPTSVGMVEIARRALVALGAPVDSLPSPRSDPAARARFRAWYARQVVRDRRRRVVERWRYRHEL